MPLANQLGIDTWKRLVACFVLICLCGPMIVRGQAVLPEGLAEPLPDGAVARFGMGKPPRESKSRDSILLTFTPNGRFLIYSDGVTVFVWDPRTGAAIKQWRNSTWGYVRRLAVSPDSKKLAIATTRGLMVANLEGGDELLTCDHWYNQVCRATGLTAFLPQGNAIVAMEMEGEIHLVTSSRSEIRKTEYQNGHALAGVSPDGATMTVWNQQSIDHWNLVTLTRTSSTAFPYFTKFSKLRMSPDGSLIAIDLSDGGVELFDTAASKLVCKLDDPKLDPDKGLQFTPDGRRLVTVCRGDNDAKVGIWDNATGKLERSFSVAADEAGEPFVSPDGELIAFVTSRYDLILKSLRTGKAPFGDGKISAKYLSPPKSTGLDGPPVAIQFAPRNRVFAADSSKIQCWDRSSGEVLHEIKPKFVSANLGVPLEGQIANLVVPLEGQSVIASGPILYPTEFEVRSGRPLGEFVVPASLAQREGSFAISSNGKTLKALTRIDPYYRYTLIEWDIATRKQLSQRTFTAKERNEFMTAPSAFMVAGEYVAEVTSTKSQIDWIAGVSMPGSIVLRSMGVDRPVRTFATCEQANFVAGSRSILVAMTRTAENEFTPKSAEVPKTIVECWEIATGEKFVEWSIPSVTDFALSPNNRTIALAQEGTILLQNLDDDQPVKLQAASKVTRLIFSADGRWLASGHEDTTVVIWDVSRVLRIAPNPAKPTALELDACWRNLAADAKSAIRAANRLSDDPTAAVALFRERLTPAGPINPNWLNTQLADLDSPSFRRRESASRQLSSFGERLQPLLTNLKNTTHSAEVRRRACQLLEDCCFIRSPEQRRRVRAVELLERIATPDAAKLLFSLAKGDTDACETRAAIDALRRMAERVN